MQGDLGPVFATPLSPYLPHFWTHFWTWTHFLKVERGGGMAAATVAATVQLVRHNAEGSVMTFTE